MQESSNSNISHNICCWSSALDPTEGVNNECPNKPPVGLNGMCVSVLMSISAVTREAMVLGLR